MPALRLLCNRPLWRDLEPRSTRFVVGKVCGLQIEGRRLEMGEEVPPGSLTPYALNCVYERPLALIEERNYALTIDGLREAMGVDRNQDRGEEAEPDAPAEPVVVKPDL